MAAVISQAPLSVSRIEDEQPVKKLSPKTKSLGLCNRGIYKSWHRADLKGLGPGSEPRRGAALLRPCCGPSKSFVDRSVGSSLASYANRVRDENGCVEFAVRYNDEGIGSQSTR
jgi:hypothetical protein